MTINQEQDQAGGVIPAFHIGWRMKMALEHAGMPVQAMADYLGVHQASVTRWTKGKTPPGKQTLRLWALRTGVSLEWLETGNDVRAWRDSNPQPSDP